MMPVHFENATEIQKPDNMTDEECLSAWATFGFDTLAEIFNSKLVIPPTVYEGVDLAKFPFYITAWKPNKEDLDALNAGRPVYVKTLSKGLPPMALFTLDGNNGPNF